MNPENLKLLTLNITEVCDAACRYCNWWRGNGKHEPLDSIIEAITQAASLGAKAVRLSGGEPLLHPDITEIVGVIRRKGMTSMVCTAASCSSHRLIETVDAGLDIISVSLDTLDEGTFKTIRGYDIQPVLENLNQLIQYRKIGGFEMVLSVVLSPLSLPFLSDVLSFVDQHHLVISITPCHLHHSINKTGKEELGFTTGDIEMLHKAVQLVQQAAATGVRIINSDQYLEGIVDYCSSGKIPTGHSCRAGEDTAIREVGGAVKLCHMLWRLPDRDLTVAWRSSHASKLREQMLKLDCPGCWLSCHADLRRSVQHRYGRPEIWDIL
ncbi:MAG: radical SAM protein [Desulfuromonadaceae bacterium]